MVTKALWQRHSLRASLLKTACNGQVGTSAERRRLAKLHYAVALRMPVWCHVRGITSERPDFRCPLPRNHGLLIPPSTAICHVGVWLRRCVGAWGVEEFSSGLFRGEDACLC